MSEISEQIKEWTTRFTHLGLSLIAHEHVVDDIIIPVDQDFLASINELPRSEENERKITVAKGFIETAQGQQTKSKKIRGDLLREENSEDFKEPNGDNFVDKREKEVVDDTNATGMFLWDHAGAMNTREAKERAKEVEALYNREKRRDVKEFVRNLLEWYVRLK